MKIEKDKIETPLKEIKDKIELIKASKPKQKMFADCVVCIDEDVEFDYEGAYNSIMNNLDYINYRFQDVYSYVSSLAQELYKHCNEGHLPSVNSPDEMQKALDALGQSANYQVVKRTIFASDGKKLGLDISIRNK